jgi:hypothetical protein
VISHKLFWKIINEQMIRKETEEYWRNMEAIRMDNCTSK